MGTRVRSPGSTLDQGKPAAGNSEYWWDCGGKVLAQGVTDASGLVRVRKPLPPRDQLPGCRSSYDRELFVTARRGMDVSFTFSNWNDGIAPWRFNVREGGGRDATIATTVFDRTLLRAGDTVGMKHLLRVHTSNGFQVGAAKKLPTRAILTHGGSDQRWELPLEWDTAAGVAESTWAVPKDAKTGTYSVLLAGPKRSGDSGDRYPDGWTTGSFRVEEFRVPVLKAQLQAPVKPQVNVSQTEIGLQLGYLSGGAAGYQRVKLRSVLQPKAVIFADHDGVGFANGDVRVGREESGQRRWAWEATEDGDAEVPEGAVQDPNVKPLATRNVTLDGGGAATVQIGDLPKSDVPRDLVAEMEYADPNGEILTRSTRVALWPARVLLGIKPDGWALSKDKVKLQVIAVDTAGHVVSGVDVKVDVFERRPFSHRKRLIGGFYAYEYGSDVQRLGDFCSGTTDDKGRVFCEAPAPVSGNLILRAKARDADGNDTVARSDVWVTGDGDWWFDVANDDRMDVLPERKRYEPGETATFQVRAPFRSAAALVTVEREGVIDGFVTTLSGKSPVVHVPLKGNYAPNAFVSVFAVRGRVADVPPTALVDLGKPAFRMGLAEILVGWKAHELAVTVRPSAEIFRTRDRVKVAIDVKKATGGAPGKGAEVALAAVDEALLELMPNESWKLLDTMMAPRGLEVQTATAAMQVVGRRHYGRKALPAGGGGGRQTSRELFDTLLLWKARVKLDAAGHAEVEVPLNDSLSSFRIVAVATAGSGLFGTGQASVRTSQDLMLLSGLPPLVREQDRFAATFTVRNASARPLDVKVDAAVTAGGKVVSPAPEGRMLSLEPGAAQDVTWQIVTPVGTDSLQWQVNARETGDGDAKDGLKAVQKVIAAVPVRTFQATLLQLDGAMDMPVARPADAIAGRGGIAVDLKARLGDELAGVREWMERYPYSCLEQRASVAVALEDESRWKWLMAALPAYLDRDGLAKYFPMMTEGSDTLTAYLLAVADESGWQIPETSRNRMLNGLTGFVTGSVIRHGALPTADLAIRKVAALDAMARHLPAIDPELLGSFSVEPDLWPTSAVIDWWSLAKRWDQMPERDARKTQAERILRSRLNFQGTTMGFSTERTDFLWWLMVSGDVNANRALLALMEEPKWKDDLPRMVRGAVGRQQRGAWNTTVANAWGALALRKFSSVFESEPVTGTSQMAIGNRTRTQDWAKQGDGGQLFQEWPRDPTDLRLTHDGSGKPWVTVRSLAAIPLKTPLSSGYRITRQVQPVEGANLQAPRRGDVWRVSISVEAQSDMTWVVVNDPIPAGAGILGTGLGGDSATLTTGEKRRGWVWPAFEERTFDSFRAYYRFVPKGTFTVEYTVRLHNAGSFELPPTRVEALYAPEMFGEIPNERVVVKEP
ncbi:MAG: alpha-2-macroglobulin [Burkholderiales bacterium]|nr:alpha-2-macroglobulin [Burkholderiales bacterium]